MLDRAKLFKEITRVSDALFISYTDEYACARAVWERIITDPSFADNAIAQQWSLPIPTWSGPLDATYDITQASAIYRVIAVDGSQIYPDRHQGTSCYLINFGCIVLTYAATDSYAQVATEPYVFTGDEDATFLASSTDIVNALREAYEFEAGLTHALRERETAADSMALLFDGSLIFWHLESKDASFKTGFINRYVATLTALYEHRILYAAYVSMPRHREVSNLLRLALCNFDCTKQDAYAAIEHVTDAAVMNFFLQPGQRSTVFAYTGSLRALYPEPTRPHFFYLNTGYEIGRVEIPAWIARNQAACDGIAGILLDQARKGNGYPVALAEAHEQAVVKGPDRDFFYQVITKYALQQNKRIEISPKSMKKRSIGI